MGQDYFMEKQQLIDSIAYCGLVCGLCHLRSECDGCKNTAKLCSRSDVCYQRNCCIQKGIQGCWECADFPCGKDMHSDTHDLRIRAFVTFIKMEGPGSLIDCLIENEERGIHYGYKKDYDGLGSEAEVIHLLKFGKT